MKLNLDQPEDSNVITAQGPGFITINGDKQSGSLIIGPKTLITGWAAEGFDGLTEAAIQQLADLGATITLIGTGKRQRFPASTLLKPLIMRGAGYEIMDTAAACRTFNILAAEGRSVIAGLIVEAG